MAKKELKEEVRLFNDTCTYKMYSDNTSEIVWDEGVAEPQTIPNKKVGKG